MKKKIKIITSTKQIKLTELIIKMNRYCMIELATCTLINVKFNLFPTTKNTQHEKSYKHNNKHARRRLK